MLRVDMLLLFRYAAGARLRHAAAISPPPCFDAAIRTRAARCLTPRPPLASLKTRAILIDAAIIIERR